MAMRSEYCGLVTEALLGQTVTLCGWVNRRRDHGGVIFIDLRDREGYVQVVCDPDRPEMFKVAEDVRNEFCIQVKGLVRARPEGTTNDNLKSGKIEVLCHELNVLNASVTPPFQLDDDNLSGSLKGVRDAVAAWLGVDDRDRTRVRYVYEQQRAPWGVGIEFKGWP